MDIPFQSEEIFGKCNHPTVMKQLLLIAALTGFASSLHAQVSLGDAVDNTNLVWTSGGNAAWIRQTAVTHDGVDAAQSGAIFDYQESWLQTTVTGPGTLTFWWRVSSEEDFDYLRFHIDGILQHEISGEVPWQQRSYNIAAGNHVLRWRYVKDPNTLVGQDRGWVDQVTFTTSTGAPVIVAQPVNQVVWEGANVSIPAIALGAPPLVQQWYFNETNAVDGATNATLVISNALPAQAGAYRLEVSNGLGAVTSTVARLTLTNNGPVTRILLFVDSPVPSPFEAALAGLALNFEQFFFEFDLNAAVTGANPATTLVIVDVPQNNYAFNSLPGFVGGGGRVLLEGNTLIANLSLATALRCAVDVRLESPQRVYDWRGSPLFTGLSSSLNFVEIGLQEDVQRLHALPGGHAVAGFTPAATPGVAAVIVGNNGRTLVNGFWMGGGNPGADAVRLAQNEILFLTGPVSATAPVIRIPPRSQTRVVGSAVTLDVVAWGALPLSYRWFFNETDALASGSGASFTLPSVQLADSGQYSVVVSNVYGAVTSSPVSLVVVTNPPIQTILVFIDGDAVFPSALERALNNRGLAYQRFTDVAGFNAAVAAADPLSTAVVIDATQFNYSFDPLPAFIGAGGKALLQYWGIANAGPLASAFQASVTPAEILTSPMPLHNWGGSSFFDGLSSPLTLIKLFNVEGARLQPTGNAQSVAGFVPTRTANQAAVIVGNSGRTILHGFLLEEGPSFEEAARFAQNELDFLIQPLPAEPPRFTTVPQGLTIITGGTGVLRVQAGGSLPLSYQWRKDGAAIDGATNSSLRLTNVQFEDIGGYEVVISNAHGEITSNPATVAVADVAPIAFIVLLVDAESPVPSPYPAALSALGLPFQQVGDEASLEAALASVSPEDTLVVADAAWSYHYFDSMADWARAGGRAILQYWNLQPGSRLAEAFQVSVGSSVTFASAIYDWGNSSLFNGVPTPMPFVDLFIVDGQLLQPFGGAQALAGFVTSPTSNQAAVVWGNLGRTFVNGIALEGASRTADAVRLLRNEIDLLDLRPPSIIAQPTNQVATLGSPVTLRVTASGLPPLFYQWHLGSAAIAGATNATYTIASVQSNHLGAYTVVINNQYGAVTSQMARLDVAIRPVVVRAPISQSVVVGGSVTFSVEITGNPPPFNYEWRKTGGTLFTNRFDSNERISFFTLTNVDAGLAGNYRVVIRNAAAPSGVSPSPFTLTILADGDGDGLPDVWEAAYISCADPAVDCDNDGLTSLEEYLAGTDPTNAASVLRIDHIVAGNSASLEFQALSNKTYSVQYTDGLGSAAWSKLADVVARPTNGTVIVSDPGAAPHRSYRLVTPRQP